MTVTLDLKPTVKASLAAVAKKSGQSIDEFLARKIEQLVKPHEYDLDALLALPRDEQDRRIRHAAELAADHYNADLARPVEQRDLTAFTALDSEDY